VSASSKNWIILIILACIWGSSFILMKKAMYTSSGAAIFTDTQVGALRTAVAGFSLLPLALRSIRKIKTFRLFILLALVGLTGNFLPAFLFTYAETGISSGYAGMMNSFTPIFAIIIGVIIFKDRLNRNQLLGIGIGSIGVITLMVAGQDLSMSGDWSHLVALVIATLCYGTSINIIKHTLSGLKSYEIASLSFMIVLLPSAIIALQQGSITIFETNPNAWQGFTAIVILSVIGTAFALILFNKLVANVSIVFASSVTYLIPIIAVVIGLSFGESINSYQVGAMFLVIGGVFVANRSRKTKSILSNDEGDHK
jgi:drug/metabolite transporter (DMT)-like permease